MECVAAMPTPSSATSSSQVHTHINTTESIRYRLSKFEFLLLLNKCDAGECDPLMQMMKDYDMFLQELGKEQAYLSTLSRSVVINMSECFEKIKVSKISAKTGFGFQELPKLLGIALTNDITNNN